MAKKTAKKTVVKKAAKTSGKADVKLTSKPAAKARKYKVKEIPAKPVADKLAADISFYETGTVVKTKATRLSLIEMLPLATPEQFKEHCKAIRTTGYGTLKINKYGLVQADDKVMLTLLGVRITQDQVALIEKANKARMKKAGTQVEESKTYTHLFDVKTRVFKKPSKKFAGCSRVSRLLTGK